MTDLKTEPVGQSVELKPCPFGCSVETTITERKMHADFSLMHRCRVVGPISFQLDSHAACAKRWNTRHTS